MSLVYPVPADEIKLVNPGSFWDGFLVSNPLAQSVFFDDFNSFFSSTAGYTITETDAAATELLVSAENGVLRITNSAADNDIVVLQAGGATGGAASAFHPEVGRTIWFETKLNINDKTQSEFCVGLLDTNTDPFAVSPFGSTNGLLFQKVDGSAALQFYLTNASNPSGVASLGSVEDATYMTLGFKITGIYQTELWVNGNPVGTVTAPLSTSAFLRPTVAIKNGEAAAKRMDIDYLFAAQTR